MNISKIVMYNFHYEEILKKFPNSQLLYSDTDSFIYKIKTNKDFYQEIKNSDYFDFSNYSKDHPNYNDRYHLVPGKFKDETSGVPIQEFIGLRYL